MSKPFKPMLAAAIALDDLPALTYPIYGLPKLDGIRAIVRRNADGELVVLSRSLKPIPNKFIQQYLTKYPELENCDGELIVGRPTAENCYNVTESAVMTRSGEPNFTYYVFDRIQEGGFLDRSVTLSELCFTEVSPVKVYPCASPAEVLDCYNRLLAAGYEGIMLRHGCRPYKFGRSTKKEQGLLKLKVWESTEAVIIGFEPKYTNNNAPTISPTGHTVRSSHKANKVVQDTLGALVCQLPDGIVFSVGTGFTDAMRQEFWANQDSLMGKTIRFKHIPHGAKDAPRHPVFEGFRSELDL